VTVLGQEPWVVALVAATLVVGAVVQGTVGLGLGLVSAPVVTLVAPALMPELMLWLALFMAASTLVTEREGPDWHGLGWSLPTRVPGTAVGVAIVAVATTRQIGLAVGLMVLLSVLLTARAVRLPVNRVTLPVAGFVSGVTGTTTSIGGPPLAILYQHARPGVLRPTMAVFFVVGAGMSLAGLGLVGALRLEVLALAVCLVPVLVLGIAIAVPVRRHLPAHHVRAGVLVVCATSALALLVRSAV
jgi:uncharacterized membrane protein YfcA